MLTLVISVSLCTFKSLASKEKYALRSVLFRTQMQVDTGARRTKKNLLLGEQRKVFLLEEKTSKNLVCALSPAIM